jgi:nitrogenase molybdenum-iron protein alpha/beta subunit
MATSSKTQDLSLRTSPTFIDGVLLSANAISDALLVFRGGTCLLERIGQVFDEHDLTHDLVGPDGKGRLALTLTDCSAMTMGAVQPTEGLAAEAVAKLRPGLVLLAELSMVTLAGEDLRDQARNLSRKHGLPVVAATSRSMERDYRDAFESILGGIAETLPADACAAREADSVALLGLFCERGEGDWEGNRQELERLVGALGLRLCPPWLCGGSYRDLAAAGRAAFIAALPAGRQAAQTLARRSRAKVIPLGLPVGLEGTAAWLRRLAAATGRAERAEGFIRAELRAVLPRLDRVLLRYLAGRRVALIASEEWLRVLPGFFERELGMAVPVRLARQRSAPAGGGAGQSYDPSVDCLNRRLTSARRDGGLDLIIGSFWERNSLAPELQDIPFMEFGFPCRTSHFLAPAPFLGWRGVLTWAEQLTQRLLRR